MDMILFSFSVLVARVRSLGPLHMGVSVSSYLQHILGFLLTYLMYWLICQEQSHVWHLLQQNWRKLGSRNCWSFRRQLHLCRPHQPTRRCITFRLHLDYKRSLVHMQLFLEVRVFDLLLVHAWVPLKALEEWEVMLNISILWQSSHPMDCAAMMLFASPILSLKLVV